MEDVRNNLEEIKLCEIIRNYILGEPEFRYDEVMIQFKSVFQQPICCWNCRYRPELELIKDGFPCAPFLYRSTHKMCSKCNMYSVSLYQHDVCHMCAKEINEIEFAYHHGGCNKKYRE